MIILLARLLSRLSLRRLQALGRGLGWIAFLCSPRYRARIRANLAQAGLAHPGMPKAVARELGAGVLELAFVWLRPVDEVLARLVDITGEEAIEEARATGRGVIFLTPHLGCFELAGLYLGHRFPMTVMYRPPHLRALEPLMQFGRLRVSIRTGTTDVSGVRKLLLALKAGETIGLLPDQVPQQGAGEWADFFGRPAYTTNLPARLAEATGAAIVMTVCERLPRGCGYSLHFQPIQLEPGMPAPLAINRAMEALIRRCPTQYLWSYNRFKRPRRASAAPAGDAAANARGPGTPC